MPQPMSWLLLSELVLAGVFAAAISAALIAALLPLLVRHSLAQPNARSSHAVPTPQGGGAAVVVATLLTAAVAAALVPDFGGLHFDYWILFGAVIALAIIGGVDDVRTIEALPRLALQLLGVIAVAAVLPTDMQFVPGLPLWIERIVIVVAGLWFINLVNFMDGIDWMTVAEVAAVTIGFSIVAVIGALPPAGLLVALSLLGATLGFAPYNRPVARLFLGDVGSLPIGLLLFWLLLQLASHGYLCAALLLPLYYTADATITLLRRLLNGEPIMQAHRSHFYQRATERGLSVREVIARVTAANGILIVLSIVSAWMRSLAVDVAALVIGSAAVVILLVSLSRGRR